MNIKTEIDKCPDYYYLSDTIFIFESKYYQLYKHRGRYKRKKISNFHWLRLCKHLGWYPLHKEWIDIIDPRERVSYTRYGVSCFGCDNNFELTLSKCIRETFRWRDTPEKNISYIEKNPKYNIKNFKSLHDESSMLTHIELIVRYSKYLQLNIILLPHLFIYKKLTPYICLPYNNKYDSIILYHTENFDDLQIIGYFDELIFTHFCHDFLSQHCQGILRNLVDIDTLTLRPKIIPTFFGKPISFYIEKKPQKEEIPPPKIVWGGKTTLTW